MFDANSIRYPRRPLLNILSREELDELHYASLEVLERTGLNIGHPEAVALLSDAGAMVDSDGKRVRIPSNLVKQALHTAPSRVALVGRTGQQRLFLEDKRSYFGTGSDLEYTIDLESGEKRLSVLADIERAALLTDALPNYDFIMCHGLASDVPVEMTEIMQLEAMIRNSTKPMLLTSFSEKAILQATYEMACVVRGGEAELRKDPYFVLYGQFISPFEHDRVSVERLLFCAEKHIPITYIPTIMAGASGPVTFAGSLVVANVECLAGLIIHQLKQPGAPFIYGGCVNPFDMRNMCIAYGAPEWRLTDAALSQLSRRYDLPVFGTAGCTDSKIVDEQAALEGAFSIVLTALSGTNLIHDVSYLQSGLCGSPDFTVMCDEMIGMTRRILQGIEVNSETLALDVINAVGPGRDFTAEEHTMKHFKSQAWYPGLLDRKSSEAWEKAGSTTLRRRCAAKARDILANHAVDPLSKEQTAEIQAILTHYRETHVA
jgi:trimethylamine--corrinoid protein Co-methyltransferase